MTQIRKVIVALEKIIYVSTYCIGDGLGLGRRGEQGGNSSKGVKSSFFFIAL